MKSCSALSSLAPCFFLSHGGPAGMLVDGLDVEVKAFLKKLGKELIQNGNYKGIVAVSAHWYNSSWSSSSSSKSLKMTGNRIIHDFGEFFKGIYEIQYPIRAFSDEMLQEFLQLTRSSTSSTTQEFTFVPSTRGVDHGIWIPMKIMDPLAQLPVLQLELPSENPQELWQLGQQLKRLRQHGYVIMASGGSVHNLPFSFSELAGKSLLDKEINSKIPLQKWAKDFETLLFENCLQKGGTFYNKPKEFAEKIQQETQNYQQAHPTNDHFAPLYVAWAASSTGKAKKIFDGWSLGNLGMHDYEFD